MAQPDAAARARRPRRRWCDDRGRVAARHVASRARAPGLVPRICWTRSVSTFASWQRMLWLGTGPLLDDGVAVAEELAALPEVEQVTPVRLGSGALRAAGRGRRTDLVGVVGGARGTWTVLEGDDLPPPRRTGRCVDRRQSAARRARGREARRHGPAPWYVPRGFRRAAAARGAGSRDRRFSVSIRRHRTPPLWTSACCRRVCALDDGEAVDFLLVGSSAGALRAVEAIALARPDLHAFSNRQLVERMGVSNFSYFRPDLESALHVDAVLRGSCW